jgi:hypothetical protein
MMLVELRAVVERHVPAAEIDHPRAGGAVDGIERRGLRHGIFSWRKKGNGAARFNPLRPVCPFYLRDCGGNDTLFPPACPFGGPRAVPSLARPLSRSIVLSRSPFA